MYVAAIDVNNDFAGLAEHISGAYIFMTRYSGPVYVAVIRGPLAIVCAAWYWRGNLRKLTFFVNNIIPTDVTNGLPTHNQLPK